MNKTIELPQVEKGTKIICPKCGVLIGEFKRTIRGGEIVKAEDIEFFMGNFKNGDYADCPRCGFPFMVELVAGGQVSTEKGWLPLGIPTKALIPSIERFLKRKKKKESCSREKQLREFKKSREGC
jgi:DNA-directed RNA polymerase subunit RPC12/RpoP